MIKKHPCEVISKHVLPAFRSLIAKGLIEDHGLTQTIAAEKLGITQAAISYYISSKRGEKYLKQLENNSTAKSVIKKIIDKLAAGSLSADEVMGKLCDLCMSLRNSNELECTNPPLSDSIGQDIEYYI